VFAYRSSRLVGQEGAARGAEQAALLRSRSHRQWKKRLYTTTLLVLLAFLLVDSLRLSSAVKVVTLSDGGGQIFLRDTKVYQADAQKLFGGAMDRNKLTANTATVADRLRSDFPELKTVSVSLPILGKTPVVYIQPVMPRLVVATPDNMQYVLDGSGAALINAAQVPELAKLNVPTVHDQSGVAPEVGKLALPGSTVGFISQLAGQLNAKQLTITDATLLIGGNELQVKVRGVAYYVKFDTHGDAREEAGALMAVKQNLDAAHKTPHEYVDVRVEGKAYYK
jgi:hypothetical protein